MEMVLDPVRESGTQDKMNQTFPGKILETGLKYEQGVGHRPKWRLVSNNTILNRDVDFKQNSFMVFERGFSIDLTMNANCYFD